MAEWYIETTEEFANHGIELQGRSARWAQNTPWAPLFEAQSSMARELVKNSAMTARNLWQVQSLPASHHNDRQNLISQQQVACTYLFQQCGVRHWPSPSLVVGAALLLRRMAWLCRARAEHIKTFDRGVLTCSARVLARRPSAAVAGSHRGNQGNDDDQHCCDPAYWARHVHATLAAVAVLPTSSDHSLQWKN